MSIVKQTCTSQQIKLFQSQLHSILFHVTKQNLTFQQLYLIYYESNIKFLSHAEQTKIKEIFQQNGNNLPLRECINLIQLHSCEILHNRPVFYIIVHQVKRHKDKECFQYFKAIMQKNYGVKMKWFGVIANDPQARKIKSIEFKLKVKQMLRGSPHEGCGDIICRKFPKNTKNEIQWSTFMAIVRFIEQKYQKSTILTNKQLSRQFNIQLMESLSIQQKTIAHYINKPHGSQTHNKISKNRNSQKQKNPHKRYYLRQRNSEQNQFMLKSSIQISKQYEQVMQKFNCNGRYSNRYRANSANLNRKLQSNNTTSTNWRNVSVKANRKNTNMAHFIDNMAGNQNRDKMKSVIQQSRKRRSKYDTEPNFIVVDEF